MSAVPQFDAKSFVDSLPARPGVYRMLDAQSEILYVGKARNLKSRVGSYFQPSNVHPKVQALVAKTCRMEVTITNSDTEALLLEFNLIKKHRPRFNVVLRDDKSFPFVHLETDHEFPRLAFYRGSRKEPGRFFGPYPSAGAVRETLQQLQKLFRLRNCEDTYFANRSRPCLQYQIQRCTAPCVGLIAKESYARDAGAAIKVLEGRNDEVSRNSAGAWRRPRSGSISRRRRSLRDQLGQSQSHPGPADRHLRHRSRCRRDRHRAVLNGEYCVALMFVRGGRSLGSTTFFPRAPFAEPPEVLAQFVSQYYLEREAPAEIIVERDFEDMQVFEATPRGALGPQGADHRPRSAGLRARWLEMMRNNAEQALKMRNALPAPASKPSLDECARYSNLDGAPNRIECFDISHTGGTETVASCVVFGAEGPLKSDYRRFNIAGIAAGRRLCRDVSGADAALQARTRRRDTQARRAVDRRRQGAAGAGGQGTGDLGVEGITLIGVAKGADRRPGQEQLFLLGQDTPTILPPDSGALHLIQRVRDEAHRFAIAGHRRKRAKRHNQSILETIPGLGPVKRRELLKQFGGLQGILRAGIDDFVQIRGLGRDLAQVIYEHLHPGQ